MKKLKLIGVLVGSLFLITSCDLSALKVISKKIVEPTEPIVEPHEHTFKSEYSFDDRYHWRDSTCGHDLVSNFGKHNFDEGISSGFSRTFTCKECGFSYNINDIPSYKKEWSYDEVAHWKDPTVEGAPVANYEEHSYEISDFYSSNAEWHILKECECGKVVEEVYFSHEVEPLSTDNSVISFDNKIYLKGLAGLIGLFEVEDKRTDYVDCYLLTDIDMSSFKESSINTKHYERKFNLHGGDHVIKNYKYNTLIDGEGVNFDVSLFGDFYGKISDLVIENFELFSNKSATLLCHNLGQEACLNDIQIYDSKVGVASRDSGSNSVVSIFAANAIDSKISRCSVNNSTLRTNNNAALCAYFADSVTVDSCRFIGNKICFLSEHRKSVDETELVILNTYSNTFSNNVIENTKYINEICDGLDVCDSTLYISKPEGLSYFSFHQSLAHEFFIDNVVLENDIDMKGFEYKPLVQEDDTRYVLDGNSHTIKNLTIKAENAGLFENLICEVFNLTLENANIEGTYKAGAFAAEATDRSVRLSNCHVINSQVTCKPLYENGVYHGGLYVGGIIGEGRSVWLLECSVKLTHIEGLQYIGGMIGYTYNGRCIGCEVDSIYLIKKIPTFLDFEPAEHYGAFVGMSLVEFFEVECTSKDVYQLRIV